MNLEEMKRKYAYTLARVGLNVQKGQTVLVEAAIEGSAFTPVFCEECYKLGASNVVVHYLDQANLKVASLYRSKEDVEKVVKACRQRYPWLEQKYIESYLIGVVYMCIR